MMKKRNAFLLVLFLFLAGFLSRWPLAEKSFNAMDSVQYAIATLDYSIPDDTPPAPGHFLYIMSGRFLNLFFKNAHDSLVFISALYSGLIASILFLLGEALFGSISGLIASCLFLTSPVFWFKGVTIYGYLNAGFFLLLAAFFCYRTIQGEERAIYFASLVYALLAGTRPQELPLFILLFLFSLRFASVSTRIKSIFIFVAVCLIWFLPMLAMSGGLKGYLEAIRPQALSQIEYSIFGGQFLSRINSNLSKMWLYSQRAYFLGILALLYYVGRFFYLPGLYTNRKSQFFMLLMVPALLFNVLVRFGELGHGLAWGLGLLLIIAESTVVLAKDAAALAMRFLKRKREIYRAEVVLRGVFLACFAVTILSGNVFLFFRDFNFNIFNYHILVYDDRQFNYSEIRKVDNYLLAKVDYVKSNFDTHKILIIPSSRFWRQVMYYFPEARVVQSDNLIRKDRKLSRFCFGMKCENIKDKQIFEIPSGVTDIVIFDDILIPYVKLGQDFHIVNIKGTLKILVIDARKYKKIGLTYNSITFD